MHQNYRNSFSPLIMWSRDDVNKYPDTSSYVLHSFQTDLDLTPPSSPRPLPTTPRPLPPTSLPHPLQPTNKILSFSAIDFVSTEFTFSRYHESSTVNFPVITSARCETIPSCHTDVIQRTIGPEATVFNIARHSSSDSTKKYSQPTIRYQALKRSHSRINLNHSKERNPVSMRHRIPLLLVTYDSQIGSSMIPRSSPLLQLYFTYEQFTVRPQSQERLPTISVFSVLRFSPRVVQSVVRGPGIMDKN